ncbi:MAG: CsbD family protein [Actinomycetota bacterium]
MAGERDKAEGTWDEAKGAVKEKAGEATGDRTTEAEGKGY